MFFGYNFYYDSNSLSPSLVNVENMTSWKIQNGIFTELYIQKGINDITLGTIPLGWDENTLALCDFNNNIELGNVKYLQENISKVLIVRRIKVDVGQTPNEWVTLAEIMIDATEDFKFVHHDYYSANHIEYDFGLIVIDKDGNTQKNTYVKSIMSLFNQVMLVDSESVFYLTAEYSTPSASRVQVTSTNNTLGNKYPIVVKNGSIDYNKLSVSSILMVNTKTNDIERLKQVALQNNYLNNIVNGKPKILKDLNGNIWLLVAVSEPNVEYFKELGNGIATISFDAVEVGNANSNNDLIENGLTPIKPIFEYNNVKTGYPKIYNYPTGTDKLVEDVVTDK